MGAFTGSRDDFSFTGTLDSKGRITIPARIRKRAGIEKGDKVRLAFQDTRKIRIPVSGKKEALDKIEEFSEVESFSFEEGVLVLVISR